MAIPITQKLQRPRNLVEYIEVVVSEAGGVLGTSLFYCAGCGCDDRTSFSLRERAESLRSLGPESFLGGRRPEQG